MNPVSAKIKAFRMEYELIRSNRKTLAAQIKEGRLIVRAPHWVREKDILQFIADHRSRLESLLEESRAQAQALASIPRLSQEELLDIIKQAKAFIPSRVAYYAPQVGVHYKRISIRTQRGRWGSCSSQGNLNFNCLLMLAPREVLDSVVVHELCHLREANHSARFYEEVLRVYPEYRRWDRWLKENGKKLLARRPV